MKPVSKKIRKRGHITVLVPTRGRVKNIDIMLQSMMHTVVNKKGIDVWIYVDNDDLETQQFLKQKYTGESDIQIHMIVGERPISQGEICNNLCRSVDSGGDIFFSTCDDYRFVTNGWDEIVREAFNRYPDNILMAYPHDSTAATGQATHILLGAEWINGLGRFFTEFFPFWYDDAWIDDVAQLINRKIELDFYMEPQGGKGKTPRMKNLIFWEKFFLDTLDDRVDDAKKLLFRINPEACASFPEKGTQADKVLKQLAFRRSNVDMRMLKEIETQLSDQGRFWRQMQTDYLPAVNYMLLENRAASHLLKKTNPLMARGLYEKVTYILDTLSHATHRPEIIIPIKEYVQGVIKASKCSFVSDSPETRNQSSVFKTEDVDSKNYDRLDQIIVPEILNDGLFHAIKRIASQDDVITALEIGSSDGTGSTRAFLTGLSDKSDVARLFCMEISEGRFKKLQSRVKDFSYVHCINSSSVSLDRFPTQEQVTAFYNEKPSALKAYPLSQVLQWLQDDKSYMTIRKKDENGVRKIKNQYNIHNFDMVLIDGSEFSGVEELNDVYGAKYILLDDIRTYKNFDSYHRLSDDPNYELIEEDQRLRNGYAIFKKVNDDIPIHFFTIVLNGEPFIRYHLDLFRQLPFKWHWHVIEGVADLKNDTAWSVAYGGRIDSSFHSNGLSVDGTRSYLDEIAAEYPDQITLYRKPKGTFWNGKREMVSAPLNNLPDNCLLWQVDVDEIWKVEQICKAYELFCEHPEKTAAFFHCHFFVAPDLLTITTGTYSHRDDYEWIRLWRYRKGMQWKSHEPPCLMVKKNRRWVDSAKIDPFTHQETEAAGLVFSHHAYSLESQVHFKESYYGYQNAVDNWHKLQQAKDFPLQLGDYFPWVDEDCFVDRIDRRCIGKDVPSVRLDEIIHKTKPGEAGNGPHIIIDGVIFQLQAKSAQGISRVWSNLIPELRYRMPHARFTVLQRKGFPIPFECSSVKEIPPYRLGDEMTLDKDDDMLHKVCSDLKADVFISTYFTRAPGVTNLVMMYDMIPEKMGLDLNGPEWVAKKRAIETADAFTSISLTTQADLVEIYPQVAKRPMKVTHIGLDPCFKKPSRRDMEQLQKRLKLDGPYVMLVGNRHGYKNGEAALKTLAQLKSDEQPTVLCVGGESRLSPVELDLKEKLDVRYVGRLDDKALAAAYGGAQALLVPSQYEGFGLPVIEAMACGCQVIAHPSNAVTEVGADAVHYVDMSSVKDLHSALKRTSQKAPRKAHIQKGYDLSKTFNWRNTAQAFQEVITEIVERPNILLTAVVSTFKAAQYIHGCLEDLEIQTIADRLEIIVVDSASPQDEATIVRDFQTRHGNIKYIRTLKRESLYRAWNRGIKFALGNYITNANTDDRHRVDAFEQMVKVLDENENIVLVYADVIKTRTENETFNQCTPTGVHRWYDWDRSTLLEKGCFIGPQPVWRKSVHNEYGYFDENFEISSDFEFWLRISQTNEFYHIPKPLGLYLDSPESVEHANGLKKEQEDRQIIQRYRQAAAEKVLVGVISDKKDNAKAVNKPRPLNNGMVNRIDSEGDDTFNFKESNQGENYMNSIEVILNSIRQLIESGNHEAAYWTLGKLLEDYPENAQLHFEMAAMAYEHSDMDKALAHYQKAIVLEPENTFYLKSLGDFYYVAKKDVENALVQYEKVLEINPNHTDALIMAGHVCVALHRYPDAQKYYEQVRQLDPGNTEVVEFLSKIKNVEHCEKTTSMSVDDLYENAQIKAREGDRKAAITMLTQLLDQDSSNANAHNDLGVLLYESGDKEQALAHYEKAASLQPENENIQKNLADYYWVEMGQYQQAMDRYVQVLKLNPQDVEAMLGCAQICMVIGRTEDARDFIDTVLQIEPWNNDAQLLQKQLGSTLDVGNSSLSESSLYDQARTKAADGDLIEAINDLEGLLARSPNNAGVHNDLGVLYYEAGDKDKALYSYEQALKLDPNDLNIRKNLADFYFIELNRAEDAMKLYLGILKEKPEDIESLIAVGMVCVSIGKDEDAKHFYQCVLAIEPWNETAQKAMQHLSDNTGEQNNGNNNNKTATG